MIQLNSERLNYFNQLYLGGNKYNLFVTLSIQFTQGYARPKMQEEFIRNSGNRKDTSAPIGAWKCNFPAFLGYHVR